MKEIKKKFSLSISEIILLIIVIPILFGCTFMFFLTKEGVLPYGFSSILGLLTVLGFDFLWVITMKLLPLKNLRIKIYMTLFVLTVSAALIACWVFGELFAGALG